MDRYTIEQVEKMNHYEVCRAYRFWPSPITENEVKAINRLCERLKEFGGFTPSISKSIGWEL